MQLRYGFEWDRDYLMDAVFRFNSILPFVSSLTVYPANFYLLTAGTRTMNWEIRAAYLVNLVYSLQFSHIRKTANKYRARSRYPSICHICQNIYKMQTFPIFHIAFDWIFTVFARAYALGPYGTFYCEGLMSRAGFSKPVIMGVLASAIISIITTFYILMMRLHQLTVAESNSRWKLSWTAQVFIHTSLVGVLIVNVAGFVIYTTDVANFDDLVKGPDLAWLVERGGSLLIFAEPGKSSRFMTEIYLLIASFVVYLPLLLFFIAHALLYLRKNQQRAHSTRTQVLTNRLIDTFSLQMLFAFIFFLIPLGIILGSSLIDVSGIVPGPILSAIRFITVMLLELNPPQFALTFILRNATHRQILKRHLHAISARILRKDVGVTTTNTAIVSNLSLSIR